MAATQTNPMKQLYGRLRELGVPRNFVRATLLPSWWDDNAAVTPAGYAEALSYVSKRLGFSFETLRSEPGAGTVPVVAQSSRVKFKLAKGTDAKDMTIARNLGAQVARQIALACRVPYKPLPPAAEIRAEILGRGAPWVSFENLVDYLWSRGVPVIHVDKFPPHTRKMQGMAANVGGRPVIVISKRQKAGAWLLFIIAHEAGHVSLRHVDEDGQILIDEKVENDDTVVDAEEKAANAWASKLLCGDEKLKFHAPKFLPKAKQLAQEARVHGKNFKVDPGHVVLNYGNSMTDKHGESFFAVANAAIKELDPHADAVGHLRSRMLANADLAALSDENAEFVQVMTGTSHD